MGGTGWGIPKRESATSTLTRGHVASRQIATQASSRHPSVPGAHCRISCQRSLFAHQTNINMFGNFVATDEAARTGGRILHIWRDLSPIRRGS